MHDAVGCRGVLECAHDRCPDRDDASAVRSRPADGARGRFRNAIGLVERKAPVELGIAGRRDAGRERDRGERDAALTHGTDGSPVQHEGRRRRFEGDRPSGDRRPHVPQLKRRGHVRVLDRPAVTRKAGPDGVERTVEAQQDETRDDRRDPRPSRRAVLRGRDDRLDASGGGGGRSSVRVWKSPAPKTTARNLEAPVEAPWSACLAGSSLTIDVRAKADRRAGLRSPRRSGDGRRAGWQAASPRRSRSPDRPAAGARRTAIAARRVMLPVRVDDEQPGIGRPLDGAVGGDHLRDSPIDAATGVRRPARGRRGQRCRDRVEKFVRCVFRSFQCRGVGFRDGQRMKRRVHVARIERGANSPPPLTPSSASQMRLMWWSAALVEAYCALMRIWSDCGITGDVQDHAATALSGGRCRALPGQPCSVGMARAGSLQWCA